jgi:hypothetical protein
MTHLNSKIPKTTATITLPVDLRDSLRFMLEEQGVDEKAKAHRRRRPLNPDPAADVVLAEVEPSRFLARFVKGRGRTHPIHPHLVGGGVRLACGRRDKREDSVSNQRPSGFTTRSFAAASPGFRYHHRCFPCS